MFYVVVIMVIMRLILTLSRRPYVHLIILRMSGLLQTREKKKCKYHSMYANILQN